MNSYSNIASVIVESPAKGIPDLSDLIGQTLGTQLLVVHGKKKETSDTLPVFLTWRKCWKNLPFSNREYIDSFMDGGFSSQRGVS